MTNHDDLRHKCTEHICLFCKNPFSAYFKANRPRKCCSAECSSKLRTIRIEADCALCGKTFSRVPTKMLTEHMFCSRPCKNQAQRLGNKKFLSMQPAHYGKNTSHNILCRRVKPWHCEECFEKRAFVLVVHHIDGNRKNNPLDASNWEVLCGSCHLTRHLKKDADGNWKYHSSSLTPRNLLPEVQR